MTCDDQQEWSTVLVRDRPEDLDQIMDWCCRTWPNAFGRTWRAARTLEYVGPAGFRMGMGMMYAKPWYFRRQEDATLFKLTWG